MDGLFRHQRYPLYGGSHGHRYPPSPLLSTSPPLGTPPGVQSFHPPLLLPLGGRSFRPSDLPRGPPPLYPLGRSPGRFGLGPGPLSYLLLPRGPHVRSGRLPGAPIYLFRLADMERGERRPNLHRSLGRLHLDHYRGGIHSILWSLYTLSPDALFPHFGSSQTFPDPQMADRASDLAPPLHPLDPLRGEQVDRLRGYQVSEGGRPSPGLRHLCGKSSSHLRPRPSA